MRNLIDFFQKNLAKLSNVKYNYIKTIEIIDIVCQTKDDDNKDIHQDLF